MKKLRIIDSTTISLFSNLLFKGVGRHPKTGKKKGGIVRIVLMYYINLNTFFERPDEDLKRVLQEAAEAPPVKAD